MYYIMYTRAPYTSVVLRIIMLINYFLIDPLAPPATKSPPEAHTLEPKMIYHASPECN